MTETARIVDAPSRVASGSSIQELETPALLVELDVMEANIGRMQEQATKGGAGLRPHIKTHKIPLIAKLQLEAGAIGIAVAKTAEAEVFAAAGLDDIVIAYPVVGPSKWARIAELARTNRVAVNVDSEIGVTGLSHAATAAGVTIGVQVDIDTGFHRGGVQPDAAESLCRLVLKARGLRLEGITTHRGAFFPAHGDRPLAELGPEEGQMMVQIADRLRRAGLPIEKVTLGSTPTGPGAGTVPGVTEVRAGTYVFNDCMMVSLGCADYSQVALSGMVTVVSRPAPDVAIVDGGLKTFSNDYPARQGSVIGAGVEIGQRAYIERMAEEHGIVRLKDGFQPKIGDRMRFFPVHVCTTVNLSDVLYGVRGDRVETVWPVAARGRRS